MERRLAAILVGDVAGYSRLVGLDDVGTHRRLKALRAEVLAPLAGEHGGRIVRYTGDGLLAEFGSVVRATECALAVQRRAAEREPEAPPDRRLALRFGLHVGDVIVDEDELYGDGVNVAARLEQLAEPGGLCLSDRAHAEIAGKIAVDFEQGGTPPLKNIAQPIGIWLWPASGGPARAPVLAPPADKPSIAVLPFGNFGTEPTDDVLADGLVEDLTTALARLNWLFVVARTSAFALKDQSIDARDAGRRLGVRYLLEGSVRRAGDRVRITAQLIDAQSGAHVWADKFDGPLDGLFDLQDEIIGKTVAAIEPFILLAESERARHMRPEDMAAHHFYLRAVALMGPAMVDPSGGALDEARALLARAIERDPGNARALALAGYYEAKAALFGRAQWEDSLELAERALLADPDEPLALGAFGFVSANAEGDLNRAALYVERALALNPNSALFWNFAGEVWMYLGEHDRAVECLYRSIRLNPLDQRTIINSAYMAFAYFFLRQPEEAVRWAERAVLLARNPLSYRILAASLAQAGRIDAARAAMAELLKLQPNACLRRSRHASYQRPQDLALYVEALSRAGLPEEETGELAPPA
jgi:adenylate cyclase